MYICDCCGDTVEGLNVRRYYDEVPGNSMMSGYMYEVDDECSCGGHYVEAVECPICGDWVDPDECGGMHKDCYEGECNLDNVVEYARHLGDDYLFQLLTEYVFSKDEVVEILLKNAKEWYDAPFKKRIDKELKAFTDNDIGDFAEWLENRQ